MHPRQPIQIGWVGSIVLPHTDLHSVTTGELFKVTLYTAQKSSNGSHVLTALVLVYCIFGYGRTKLIGIMFSKYTAHKKLK